MRIFRLTTISLFLLLSCTPAFSDRGTEDIYDALWRSSRDHSEKGLLSDSKPEKEKNYQRAIDLAYEAVSINPDGFEGYMYLAESLGQMSLYKGAGTKVRFAREIRKAAEKAIELAPDQFKPYMILGIWHRNVATASWIEKNFADMFLGGLPDGSLEESMTYLKTALEKAPEFNKNYLELGLTYSAMHDKKNARNILIEGLKVRARDKAEEETKMEIKDNLNKLGE